MKFVDTAPVTFTWLVVLFLTTLAQHLLPRRHLLELLRKDSTNLHHLASDPIRVLITSLLWLGHLRFVIAGPVGHLVALLVGLACYPLARGRPGSPVDPPRLLSLWRFRHPPTPVA